jgi:uncharacterized protein (TIGR02145 family)
MKRTFISLTFLFIAVTAGAQSLAINTDGSPANASALLDVNSSSKGFLPPRLTTVQRDAIVSPATGLLIFNSSSNSLQFYNGIVWVSVLTPSTTAVFLPTIVIGTQQWMSNNLDVAFYRNGDPIPQVTDAATWSGLTTGAWCYYNNDSTQGSSYGKIYNWYAVNDPRGLAPMGWHVPTDDEWTTLTTTLGGAAVAGGKLKKAGTLNWTSPNTAGNNNSGFGALPGGYREIFGAYSNININGFWWSSTENFLSVPIYRYLEYTNGAIVSNINNKKYGFSVRCVRD